MFMIEGKICGNTKLRHLIQFSTIKYANDGWKLLDFQCIGALGSIMMLVFKRAK